MFQVSTATTDRKHADLALENYVTVTIMNVIDTFFSSPFSDQTTTLQVRITTPQGFLMSTEGSPCPSDPNWNIHWFKDKSSQVGNFLAVVYLIKFSFHLSLSEISKYCMCCPLSVCQQCPYTHSIPSNSLFQLWILSCVLYLYAMSIGIQFFEGFRKPQKTWWLKITNAFILCEISVTF